jgi:hypothetical protein
MRTPRTSTLTLAAATLVALAACGGSGGTEGSTAAPGSATAADSAGLQSTPPQTQGPMEMIDSSTRAPEKSDTPSSDTGRTPSAGAGTGGTRP